MLIYLAGSIPKGDAIAKSFINWRDVYTKEIQKNIPNAKTIDPNVPTLEGDSLAVTGADCWLIKSSNIVVTNGETKMGAGTAMELIIAKYFKKPVITVLPKNTHHRRSNVVFAGKNVEDWLHPFIDAFSDVVIERISDFPVALEKLKGLKIKEVTVIDEAISYYERVIKMV